MSELCARLPSVCGRPPSCVAEMLADHVANISAKHEGGLPETDGARAHSSDILDYFRDKSEVIASGDWDAMQQNFLDKYDALNHTAWRLTECGLSFIAAQNLHKA